MACKLARDRSSHRLRPTPVRAAASRTLPLPKLGPYPVLRPWTASCALGGGADPERAAALDKDGALGASLMAAHIGAVLGPREGVMAETWTFSEWSVGDADPAAFVDAFRRFADAATKHSGAHEGMILQDAEDPDHFVVVRRWDGPDEVARWAGVQGDHAAELMSLAPEGGRAAVMTKVADLLAQSASPPPARH